MKVDQLLTAIVYSGPHRRALHWQRIDNNYAYALRATVRYFYRDAIGASAWANLCKPAPGTGPLVPERDEREG